MTEGLFDGLMDAMDPALVSPLVAYLSSSACDVSGEVYSAAGGVISRFFIGLTPGYFNPNLTAEDIAANWDTIRNEDGYIVPDDNNGELSKILHTLKGNA